MKIRNILALSVVLTVSVLAISAHDANAKTRETPYNVKNNEHGFEIREYGPRLIAEVEVSGTREKALTESFNLLAAYIGGKNSPRRKNDGSKSSSVSTQEKIPMGVPVTTHSVGANIRMRFFLPESYTLDSLPQPLDKRIKVFELPAQKIAVLRFSGSARKDNFDRHAAQLKKMLETKGISTSGDPQEAYYNPPYTPIFLKRNEVFIPL
ncbi:MAG: heme-binding protein [Leptolyngbya sp.]|nr:heme-binding protein [Candidatus Melainabacteria bacterium]